MTENLPRKLLRHFGTRKFSAKDRMYFLYQNQTFPIVDIGPEGVRYQDGIQVWTLSIDNKGLTIENPVLRRSIQGLHFYWTIVS